MTEGTWVEWLDDDGSSTSLEYSAVTETHAQMWPIFAVLGLSALGLAIALWSWIIDAPVLALGTYVVILIAGCGLLWYQRFTAISASRQAGGSGILVITGLEKLALAFLVAGCVANGIVVAVWIARMVG